ncbi:MAG: penicillin-binding transpeptidase domain-containing protein [Cyclobacteriaceae bacterium]
MTGRSIVIKGIIIGCGLLLAARLMFIQLLDPNYQRAAEDNVIQKIIEYPYRGLITDRDNHLLVFNSPVYDLLVVPNEVSIPDTARFLQMLEITQEEFDEAMFKAKKFSRKLPSVLLNQIANEHLARIQGDLLEYEGFFIQPRTVREYEYPGMSHVLGYVGEVSRRQILNDTTDYYRGGDYIGISGVEKEYEKDLRGERGVSYRLVDVDRVAKGKFRDGDYDTLPRPGQNVQLTLDLELQRYAEKLMEGKIGSVVAIEPKTGEILAFVSSPDYNPSLLSGKKLGKNYGELERDSLKPLFNRALQAMYPPGSMFKTVQSLIALQEGVVDADQQIYCKGDLIGDLAPVGYYDIKRAITYSSNNYFFIAFRRTMLQNEDPNMFVDSRIGLSKWRDYVTRFGLGNRLGIDIPNEQPGFVPTVDYYDRVYGTRRWKFSNIYSLSIGQGELLVTPLQMANLGALLANRGYYYTPHLMKRVGNETSLGFERNEVGIDSIHYRSVFEGMEQVVTIGSGRRAYVKDLQICGKTSTVENPGYDHSGFMGFAPLDDPKIAIAVYVENAGWGGRAAAATAGLVIEKYLRGEVSRQWMENYVLKGDFHDPK